MNEKRFWQLVKMVDWPNCEYEKVRAMYRKLLNREECSVFRAIKSQKKNELNAIAEWMDLGVGDDGYSDLLHHIIGLGETAFNKHIKNPQLIRDRAEQYNYEESFSYCIPYDDDYDQDSKFEIGHVIHMAKASVRSIQAFRKIDNHPDRKWLYPTIESHLLHIEGVMNNFLKSPEEHLKWLTEKGESIRLAGEAIIRWLEENKMELPRKFTERDVINIYVFSNTIADAKKLLVFRDTKVKETA